ncbi:ABC transporter permease [Adhaeribacter radiodurans]|uniref:ABC transporter permease n=1 Tax=Adhaeribacter radiodurans TaxID=2745197 RepID=A0A7L7L1R8_9BACT|nr:ABC transporter permease [Adhaeribacter radiodurans]QMU26723.1 ABC transporter permease [Adhaeribacter radiodurans]
MLRNYLKISVRNLLRHKAYTFINIIGLAVGMACCTLILLYVQDELSFDTHHQQAENIYRLTVEIENNGTLEKAPVTSPPIAPQLQADFPEVKKVVRLKNPSRSLIRHGEIRSYEEGGLFADSTLFAVFTFPLTAGNPKTALAEPNSIVLSQELAIKYFGNTNPLGQVLELAMDTIRQVKVTGVLAPVPGNSHIRPTFLLPFHMVSNNRTNWWGFAYYSYILVEVNFSVKNFEAKLPGFAKKYFPEPEGTPLALHVQPLRDVHFASEYGSHLDAPADIKNVYLFSALAVFIILLACINFMNLATARSQTRSKEVGVRKVIGASRKQLISQFLSESILLAFLSLLLALVLVQLSLPAFNALAGKLIQVNYFTNGGLVASLFALMLLVGLAAGLYPALFLSGYQPVQVLKGPLITSLKGAVLRKGLVVVQFTISIALIVGTVVVYSQMQYIQQKRLGFNKEQLLSIPLSGRVTQAKANNIKNSFLNVPGVISGTATTAIPGNRGWWQTDIKPTGESKQSIIGHVFQSDFDYLKTMGMELAAGRDLSRNFATDTTKSVLLNEAAIKAFGWTSATEAIGKKIDFNNSGNLRSVVGVVKDFNFKTLRSKVEPAIFIIAREPVYYLVLRLQPQQVPATLAALSQKWNTHDNQHPFEFSFVDENLNNLYQSEMRFGKIVGVFSGLAIFIACLGLFGLASFTTEQRTKEIGIRKVLGASLANIVSLLSKDFLKLVLLANVLAWPLSWWAMQQWLQDFEYRTPISWWIFALTGALALFIALLTVSFQTVKAAIANPVKSLRSE